MSGRVEHTLSPQAATVAAATAANGGNAPPELTFSDLLDVINPLEHIPVVSHIYEKETGHQQAEGSQTTGGLLYGGPIGLVLAIADQVMKHTTGNDMTGHLAVAVGLEKPPVDKGTALADSQSPTAAPVASATNKASATMIVASAAPISLLPSATHDSAAHDALASPATTAPMSAVATVQANEAASGIIGTAPNSLGNSLYSRTPSTASQAPQPQTRTQGQTPNSAAAQLAAMGVPMPQSASPSGAPSAATAAAAYGTAAQNSGRLEVASVNPADASTPTAVVGQTAPVAAMGNRWFAAPQRRANDAVSNHPTAGTSLPPAMQQLQQTRPAVDPTSLQATTAPKSITALANSTDPLPPAPVLLGRDGQPIPFDGPAATGAQPRTAAVPPPSLVPAGSPAAIESVPTTSVVATTAQAPANPGKPSPAAIRAALAMQGLTLKAPGTPGGASPDMTAALNQALTEPSDRAGASPLSGVPDPNGLPSWADAALQKANQAYRRSGTLPMPEASGAVNGVPQS